MPRGELDPDRVVEHARGGEPLLLSDLTPRRRLARRPSANASENRRRWISDRSATRPRASSAHRFDTSIAHARSSSADRPDIGGHGRAKALAIAPISSRRIARRTSAGRWSRTSVSRTLMPTPRSEAPLRSPRATVREARRRGRPPPPRTAGGRRSVGASSSRSGRPSRRTAARRGPPTA